MDGWFGSGAESEWTTESGHWVSRHWPGEGSCSMGWVVRAAARWRLHSIQWQGRAGRTTWGARSSEDPDRDGTLQTVVGGHCAFGELLAGSLNDIAALTKGRPRPGPAAVLADWNVPQTDGLGIVSPTASEPQFEVSALAQALGLSIRMPDRMIRGPGGGSKASVDL